MTGIPDIEVVVFDVLGTLVDEPGGLRAEIRHAVPAADQPTVEQLLEVWQGHVQREQQRIARGDRPYADTRTLDREAAGRVAERAGITDVSVIDRLATAGTRLPPWDDSVSGLDRIAHHRPVLGLSNASPATLLRLDARAGLRWHQAVSADAVRAYKPAPEVYRLAVETAGCPPESVLMVAAHAWDLRAARAVGMRTAYVRRPVADPPASSDAFDGWFPSLEELAAALTGR